MRIRMLYFLYAKWVCEFTSKNESVRIRIMRPRTGLSWPYKDPSICSEYLASDNNVKYIDILSCLIVGIETESKTADNMEFWVAWNSTAITKSEHLDTLYTQESWHILQTWPLAIFLMTVDPYKS